MREALKLALEALKQIDAAMPFPVAKLAIMEAEKALAQPEQIPPSAYSNTHQPEQIPPSAYSNTHQPEQEPVANVVLREGSPTLLRESDIKPTDERLYTTPPQGIYYTPPQRTWVGLTEAQCGVLWKTNMTPFEYYQAIEAKLKEKNT